jgi:predicted kinase
MCEFVMMVGLPGSGKSYFANNMKGFKVFSSDALRKELWGSEEAQGDNNIIFNTLHKRIKETLQAGESCVLDATNLNSKKRKNFLSTLNGIACEKRCEVIATSIDKCLEMNRSRDRFVPEEVIYRMRSQFEFPIMSEGWDMIVVSYPFGLDGHEAKDKELHEKIKELGDYDQGNKNHSLTLGKHLVETQTHYIKNYMENSATKSGVGICGLLHDIGKPLCRVETKMNGESDGNSHYYGHQNVSAYESMFWGYKTSFRTGRLVEDLQLVSLHMEPYFQKDEKKLTEKAGALYNKLMWLHNADLEGH